VQIVLTVPSRQILAKVINSCGRDLWRPTVDAQNTQTASFFRHERPLGGLPDQIAHGLAERQPMAFRMCFRHLHRIVFEPQCRSRHAIIISMVKLMIENGYEYFDQSAVPTRA
jgi:hypothetical protein